jgi:hypothetical protein
MSRERIDRCKECGEIPIYTEYKGKFSHSVYVKCKNFDCENINVYKARTFKEAIRLWNLKNKEEKELWKSVSGKII